MIWKWQISTPNLWAYGTSWDYVKYPSCSCGKCECNIAGKNAKVMEDEKAHQFLMGLDAELYSALRGQILALDPLPTL